MRKVIIFLGVAVMGITACFFGLEIINCLILKTEGSGPFDFGITIVLMFFMPIFFVEFELFFNLLYFTSRPGLKSPFKTVCNTLCAALAIATQITIFNPEKFNNLYLLLGVTYLMIRGIYASNCLSKRLDETAGGNL